MVMRIGGLASGMDIDSIVEKLMQAEKAPLNKLYQTKQKYEWQRDAYRDVNKSLKAFDDFLFKEMTLQKDFYKKNVVSTNSAVSATAPTKSAGETLTIDSVEKLATAGNAKGGVAAGTAGSSKLWELGIVNEGEEQSVTMSVLQTDGKMKDVNLTFNGSDTIDSVISKLKKDTGLNAFYDQQSGQISIATQATGAGTKGTYSRMIEVEPGVMEEVPSGSATASVFVKEGLGFFNKLGFTNPGILVSNGQNAELTVNGAKIERQSNNFEIDGFNITLNNTFPAGSGQPIQLKTNVDADNMVDKIKKFVETYNGIVESMTASTKATKYRDYKPLTDEQKKDMEQKEIDAWEEKAKSGLLRSDQILTSALSSMRTTMYSKGGGQQDDKAQGLNFINTLYEMGITTSNKTSDNGKLEIDEEKLRAAIEKDPEQVYKTFSDTTKGNEGIVQQLRKNIDTTVKNIEKKAGKADSTNQSFQIGRSIREADDRIDAWKTKLSNIEARYWKQFTAMETAISKANTTSSSLFSATGAQ